MLRIALLATLMMLPTMAQAETAQVEAHVIIRRAVVLATPGGQSGLTAADVSVANQQRPVARQTSTPCDNDPATRCTLIVYDVI